MRDAKDICIQAEVIIYIVAATIGHQIATVGIAQRSNISWKQMSKRVFFFLPNDPLDLFGSFHFV